jgi:hypothetical protein
VEQGGRDFIPLVQDKDRRRAVMSAVMNPRVPQNAWNFQT